MMKGKGKRGEKKDSVDVSIPVCLSDQIDSVIISNIPLK